MAGGSVEWLIWAIIEPCMYILAASLPSYQILIVGGLLPWARKIASSSIMSRKMHGSATIHGTGPDNDQRPFSILRDSGEPGSFSVQTESDGNEALSPLNDQNNIPLATIRVRHDVDINYTEGPNLGEPRNP